MHDEITISATDKLVSDPDFDTLRRKLERKCEKGQLDAFGLYLYGLVLNAKQNKSEARRVLLESIKRNPMLWSSWQALLKCLPTSKDKLVKDLPSNAALMPFFHIEWNILACENHSECINALMELLEWFPNSTWVHAQLGETYAMARMPHESIAAFEKLRKLDPYRLDNMSTLSNQYYVIMERAELSVLVRELWKVKKYHWETCVVTGNYFSLRGDRPRAITYFQRAIQMKPDFISAWALIGHEYIELRSFAQAINAYHKGISLDPTDCRAWFGLGQAFDFLKMYSFSVQHYMKAASLKPTDERLWIALGDSFIKLENLSFAKRAYKRAINCGGQNLSQSLEKIAKVCEQMHMKDKAAKYWEKFLENVEEQGGIIEERSDGHTRAYVFLSGYFFSKGNTAKMEDYAKKCLQEQETREHGNRLLKVAKEKNAELGQRSEPDGKEKNLIFEEPINHFTVSTEEKRNVKEKSIEPLEGSHLSMEDWLKSHDEDYNE